MQLSSNALSDPGPVRERNEDTVVVDRSLGLFAVLDGMGGHDAGDVASQLAGKTLVESLRKAALPSRFGTAAERSAAADAVRAAARDASRAVWAEARRRGSKAGMGSTAAVLLVRGSVGVVAHVGDSRVYVERAGTLYPLTTDHTVFEQLCQEGMNPADARESPYASVLTRGLGQQPSVDIDVMVMDLYPGDAFLLASDGITKFIDEEQLHALLSPASATPAEVARAVMDRALSANTDDNASVIVVRAEAHRETRTGLLDLGRAQAKHRVLATLPAFTSLTFQQISQVAAITEIEEHADGAVALPRNIPGTRFYLVLEGELSMQLQGQELLRVRAGESINETAVFSGQPTEMQGVAVGPTVLGAIHRDALRQLCQREPALGVELLWRFAHALSRKMEDFIVGTLTGS